MAWGCWASDAQTKLKVIKSLWNSQKTSICQLFGICLCCSPTLMSFCFSATKMSTFGNPLEVDIYQIVTPCTCKVLKNQTSQIILDSPKANQHHLCVMEHMHTMQKQSPLHSRGILCGSAKSLWWLQGHMTLSFTLSLSLSSGFNRMLLLLREMTKMEMGLQSISVIASISWPLAVKTWDWKSEESVWFPREARMLIS